MKSRQVRVCGVREGAHEGTVRGGETTLLMKRRTIARMIPSGGRRRTLRRASAALSHRGDEIAEQKQVLKPLVMACPPAGAVDTRDKTTLFPDHCCPPPALALYLHPHAASHPPLLNKGSTERPRRQLLTLRQTGLRGGSVR